MFAHYCSVCTSFSPPASRETAQQGHSQAGKAQVESLTQSSDVPREQFHRISTQLLASLASLASLA